MDYRYKGHGFNIETKPTIDGKGWTFIANVHWVGGEKNSPRTLLTRVLRVPKKHRWRRSQTTRKWIDSR